MSRKPSKNSEIEILLSNYRRKIQELEREVKHLRKLNHTFSNDEVDKEVEVEIAADKHRAFLDRINGKAEEEKEVFISFTLQNGEVKKISRKST